MPKFPGVSHERAVIALQKAGFWVVRKSKHTSMTDGQRIITIPHSNSINAYTMGGIIKDAGLTIEEFKKLL